MTDPQTQTVNTLTTTNAQNQGAFPNTSVIAAEDAIPNALIFSLSTISATAKGDAQTARIAYVDTDPEADYVAEGEELSRKNPTISELVVPTKKVGLITVASNESYANDGVPNMLGNSLARALAAKADAAFLAEPKSDIGALGMTGLANIDGITTGKIDGSLDALIDAIGTVGTNGGTPNAIVMGYDAWAYLLKLKDANKTPVITPDVANSPTPQLFGIPVVLNTHAAKNTILLLDSSQIVSAIGDVSLATTDQRYFESDSIGLRATFRFGFGVLRPNRLAKLTIGA